MITHDEIPAYYDWLSRYVQLANWLAYRDRFASFTMHKTLSVPPGIEEGRGRTAGLEHVNNRLLDAARLPPGPRVLDAGCGFGGTIFHWHNRIGGSYDGLTLSRVQLRVARREARRRGIDGDCRFHLQSYDSPVAGTFDAVVAIESLIHSRDLDTTIPNLAKSLRPGGLMVILDDMAEVNIDSKAPDEARALRVHWGCARYSMQGDYRKAIDKAGLSVIHEEDLTPQVRPRNASVLDSLEAKYNSLYRLIPLTSARTVLSAYIGGLALERLYLQENVRYRLIVSRKGANGRGEGGAPVNGDGGHA
ncbi:MAG TPA: methyltransferase domain-containing protein [Blastocatellia bacterium]|nr:methyltransferase domain-containing protein [Blastocatellia bacterium]